VSVRSEPQRGSTFELWLPVRFGQAETRGADSRSRRLLVVDDEEAFRYVIRHIAQDAGYEVIEAADGEEGLRRAREDRPDLVVLDLHMPRLDGYALMTRLAAEGGDGIPVVICTSQSLGLEQRRALAAAHAIVPKHEVSRDALTALFRSIGEGADGPGDGA